MTNIFEQASRLNLTFESSRGALSVNDLWKLPLASKSGVSLDTLGIALKRKLRESEEESLVSVKKETLDTLRLDIIIYIINKRQQEIAQQEASLVNATKLKQLEALQEKRAQKATENLSDAELAEQISLLRKSV